MFRLLSILLAGVSVSSGAIDLTDGDVSTVGTALTNAGVSLVQSIIQFAPYLIGMAVAVFIFNWISSHTKLHNPNQK